MNRLLPLLLFSILWGFSKSPVQAFQESPPFKLPSSVLETLPDPARQEATQLYERARESPGEARWISELGMFLHAYEQYGLAAECYERAAGLEPRSFQWWYFLGQVQLRQGRSGRAVEAFGRAVELLPDYLPARLKHADALLAADRPEESARAYGEVLKAVPDSAWAHYGLGRVEAARGRPEKAVEYLEAACRLHAGFGAAHYALALSYRDLGYAEKAREHMALYREDPLGWPAVEDPLLAVVEQLKDESRRYLREAVKLGEAGRLDESVELHLKALEQDPKLVQAHLHLISLYGRLEEYGKAEAHYRAAQELDPNLTESSYNYGVVLVQQQRFAEAAELFRRTLEINPHHASAHNNLGNMLEMEGRLEEAERHYRRALENDLRHRLARFNLGRLLASQSRFEEAIEQLERIVGVEDADTPRFLYALAATHVRAGEIEKGREYALKAREKARSLGQEDLARLIERDLERLRPRQDANR